MILEEAFSEALAGLRGQAWIDALKEVGDALGYFEPIGPNHFAAFIDQSPTLIVSFDSHQNICRRSEQAAPAGWAAAKANGWSHLSVISNGDTWFRDPAVYGFFDRLVDDGFFEDFDRVVFYGAGMGGYAATAFCVTSPGSTVLALQPQASLAADKAAWDTRFPRMRRTDFSSRYGYGPDMTEGAKEVFILHDPLEAFDAMHASLFDAPYVHHHRVRLMVRDIEAELRLMDCIEPMLKQAATGRLSLPEIARILRVRRDTPRYVRRLMNRLQDDENTYREAMVCRNFVRRGAGPRFRKRLKELAASGPLLPAFLPLD